MQDGNLPFSLSANNNAISHNRTTLPSKIYIYNPLETSTKLALCILLVTVAVVGFVGNAFVLCFLKTKKKTKSFIKSCSFERNFAVYIRSLAISDVLSSLISVPSIGVELYFDFFATGWGCRIVRYFIILFPSVTMNNLLVISIEKYFSTRKVPGTFRPSTVKKMVLFAWLAGCSIVFLPTATFKGLKFDLNETHYTVVCRYDNQYLPYRIMYLSYTTFQYVIPMIVIIRINISLIITVWKLTKMKKGIDVQRDNGIRMKFRAATIRSTCIIIALTFAFIIPYLVYFAQVIYNHVTKATIVFSTDFIIRAGSALVAMANATVNFVLYFVQMKDFRAYLKKNIISWFTAKNPKPVGLSNVEIRLLNVSTLTLATVVP